MVITTFEMAYDGHICILALLLQACCIRGKPSEVFPGGVGDEGVKAQGFLGVPCPRCGVIQVCGQGEKLTECMRIQRSIVIGSHF